MRGRTNIIGLPKTSEDTGININAETQQFQVAEGNNIIAGDFVEPMYIKSINKFSESSYTLYDIYNVNKNLYIARNEGYIVIFSCTNGIINLFYTSEISNNNHLFKLEDNLFLSCANGSIFTFSVNIEENIIENITELNLTIEGYTATRVSENLILLYSLKKCSGKGDKPSFNIKYIDISDHNNICFIGENITYDNYSSYPTRQYFYMLFLGASENEIYISVNERQYSSSSSTYYFWNTKVGKFVVNSDYTSINSSDEWSYGITTSSSKNDKENTGTIGGSILFNSDIKYLAYLVLSNNSYDGNVIGKHYKGGYPELYVYNLKTNSTEKIGTLTDTGIKRIVNISKNVWCIIFSTGSTLYDIYYQIIYYNEVEKRLYIQYSKSLNSSIDSDTSIKGTDVAIFTNNTDIIFIPSTPSPAYSIPFTLDDIELILGQNKNIVKSYSGNKNLIGIAKDSGSEGSIIDVFVPNK